MPLFALITALIVALGIFLLARSLSDFRPSRKRMLKDLEQMKQEMDAWVEELVPLTGEELDTFSFNQEKRWSKKRKARGVFTTIYHEPVLAYSYRAYRGPGDPAVLYARTYHEDFAYIKGKEGVRIAVGGRELGTLQEDGTLVAAKGRKAIAEVSQAEGELLPVLVNKREVASVAKLQQDESGRLGQRAFQFVKEDMTQEEKDIFLSLAVLEIVNQSLSDR
ncbi:MAG TPA: hypothetical protein VJ933_00830 [Phaeodactylibacter sp.]|nr:hypothetical protein [Phaeodactylibacter sp.]